MKVKELMSTQVHSCSIDQPLTEAARLMWDHDIGSVPVVDTRGQLVGMITDRDICMHAYTSGQRLADEPISAAMSRELVSTTPEQDLEEAERTMEQRQLRRLPVVDGGRLSGVLSMADLARAARERPRSFGPEMVARALAGISAPRA